MGMDVSTGLGVKWALLSGISGAGSGAGVGAGSGAGVGVGSGSGAGAGWPQLARSNPPTKDAEINNGTIYLNVLRTLLPPRKYLIRWKVKTDTL